MQTKTAVDTSPAIIDIRETPVASSEIAPKRTTAALPTLTGGLLAFGIAFLVGPRTANSALSLESKLLESLSYLGIAALVLAGILLTSIAARSILEHRPPAVR